MVTTVDLRVGLNLTIGNVPISLDAQVDEQASGTVYTFDGSVQDAIIPLGEFLSYIGLQFGVTAQLPPELNLTAAIDYLVGQIILTKPQRGVATTQVGAVGQFTLTTEAGALTLHFYADSSPGAQGQNDQYVVGAAIETDLNFTNLPLVGDIPGFGDLTLTHLGFSYSNASTTPGGTPPAFVIPQVSASPNPLYTRSDPNASQAKVYAITNTNPPQNFTLASGGFSLTVGLIDSATQATIDNFALPMALPNATSESVLPVLAPYYPQPTSPPAGPVHWVDINRSFGPVSLQKIGLNYSAGEATFGISAGFTVGGFVLDLEGLAITFPLPLPGSAAGSTISFDLDGLAMDFTKAAVSISGGFLRAQQNFYGQVVVQTQTFGLKALGGYTPASDSAPASFFLYANVSVPLGGPPFMFVTGLAGGFGINRTLILPTLDQLPGYVLLPANAPAQAATPNLTIANVLPQLETAFLDRPGEYWAAAGVQFTSFEMIQSFAVLTVTFGVDCQVALLGSSAMTLPTGDPNPIAYIEIDMVASYSASSDLLAVQGKLSPASFLYGSFCRPLGGFAFYTWFGGDHRGDFVVTLGGYNPSFSSAVRPSYYPSVPRLSMSFGLGPFHVTGQAYYALTPAMMMAGQTMSATWSSGPVSAWFDTGVDFLVAWAPFHYQADAYVTIGCSVDLWLFTLRVQVGADLTVWGPPFGGRAHVDLDVVSFTISFGSDGSTPLPLDWAGFTSRLLPPDTPGAPAHQSRSSLARGAPSPPSESNIVKASVTAGLVGAGLDGYDWFLDPNDFAILTNSVVPANGAAWTLSSATTATIASTVSSYNATAIDVTDGPYLNLPASTQTFSSTQVWNPTLCVAPLNQSNVQSLHSVTLKMSGTSDGPGVFSQFVKEVSVEPMLMQSSAALWAQYNPSLTVGAPPFVPSTLVGLRITPIPRVPDQVRDLPLWDLLFDPGNATGFSYTSTQVASGYTVVSTIDTATESLTIGVSGAQTESLVNQDYVLSALDDAWVTSQRAAILSDLNLNGFSTYAPAEVDVSELATSTALTDWPIVALLGDR
jgi:hypothetical protein